VPHQPIIVIEKYKLWVVRLNMHKFPYINIIFSSLFNRLTDSAGLAVIAGIFLALTVSAKANAQCADASLLNLSVCSTTECRARQDKVHKICDLARSCKDYGLPLDEVKQRLRRNQACKLLRQDVAKCYKTAHEGHDKQIADAQKAIETCAAQLSH